MTDIAYNNATDTLRVQLCEFFRECEYSSEDSEYLLSAYDKIMNNTEARGLLERSLAIYAEDYHCNYNEIWANADKIANIVYLNEYTAELLTYICLTPQLKKYYIANNISLDIYKTTVMDLKYKLEECKLVYGIKGTFVVEWYPGFFELRRFGMGRLQFQIRKMPQDYEKDGKKISAGANVIEVHIPRSGEPLTEEACMASYLAAKEFFKDQVADDPCPFVCNTFLLYPENESFVPKHTNTYRFMKSYDVFRVEVDRARKNLWRLFDTQEQNVDKLPADTSMRRAFVDHLKKGGKIGWGYGVRFV